MTWLTLIIAIAAFCLAFLSRSRTNLISEDIDEIRNSLYEIRTSIKTMRAEWNLKMAKLNTSLLKIQQKIPETRQPYFITKDCISCGTCMPECPTKAISEGIIFEIDPELCIACSKCAKVCPVNACQQLTV